jgi:hypothetical protein
MRLISVLRGVEPLLQATRGEMLSMDPREEQDRPDRQQESLPTRRFAAIVAEQDATYPMLAPAAAVHVAAEDAFDEEILAGLVNV